MTRLDPASLEIVWVVECFEEERDPRFWNIQSSRPAPAAGRLRRPDGPGCGIELNRGYVDRHAAGRPHPRAAA